MAEPLVLHVEDDPDDAFFLKRALHKAQPGWDLRRVPSGEDAVAYLGGTGAYGDRSAHPIPDLMILDLKLTGLSGFEVLTWVRTQQELQRMPIIVLSGSSLDDDRRRAQELGASDYLVKSSDYADVARSVARLLAANGSSCGPASRP